MLTLMQGTPGSGKSTEAERIRSYWDAQPYSPGCRICSTDDFHVDGFDPLNLAYYHAWNLWEAEHWLAQGYSVVVDNTNILKAWAQPYIDAARRLGHAVQVVRCTGNYGSVHGVPAATIAWMKNNMEDLL